MQLEEQSYASETDIFDVDHSWHPFTQMREYVNLPRLEISHGKGCWLWDTEGNKYLDGNASIWTNVHGHNDEELNKAIIDQLNKVAHSTMLGLSHPLGSQLAKKLSDLTGGKLTRCFFSDNGSNAVEIALKQSFQYWQLSGKPERKKVISLNNSYHGDTFGTMSISDCGIFHERFRHWCFETEHFPPPNTSLSDLTNSLCQLDSILAKNKNQIAAFIIEPLVQGAGGMCYQPEPFLKEIEKRCKLHNIHLIMDEVFVGFGRLGHMLVTQAYQIDADFVCLAKGLTAGYMPLAATLAKESIYESHFGKYEEYKAFFHGHTFTGNPLGCAAALKNIEKLETMISNGSLKHTIQVFSEKLQNTFKNHPNIKNYRQYGMTAGLDLIPSQNESSFDPADRMGLQVCLKARELGLILRPLRDSILIVPPLVITEEEIEFLVQNLLTAISTTLS